MMSKNIKKDEQPKAGTVGATINVEIVVKEEAINKLLQLPNYRPYVIFKIFELSCLNRTVYLDPATMKVALQTLIWQAEVIRRTASRDQWLLRSFAKQVVEIANEEIEYCNTYNAARLLIPSLSLDKSLELTHSAMQSLFVEVAAGLNDFVLRMITALGVQDALRKAYGNGTSLRSELPRFDSVGQLLAKNIHNRYQLFLKASKLEMQSVRGGRKRLPDLSVIRAEVEHDAYPAFYNELSFQHLLAIAFLGPHKMGGIFHDTADSFRDALQNSDPQIIDALPQLGTVVQLGIMVNINNAIASGLSYSQAAERLKLEKLQQLKCIEPAVSHGLAGYYLSVDKLEEWCRFIGGFKDKKHWKDLSKFTLAFPQVIDYNFKRLEEIAKTKSSLKKKLKDKEISDIESGKLKHELSIVSNTFLEIAKSLHEYLERVMDELKERSEKQESVIANYHRDKHKAQSAGDFYQTFVPESGFSVDLVKVNVFSDALQIVNAHMANLGLLTNRSFQKKDRAATFDEYVENLTFSSEDELRKYLATRYTAYPEPGLKNAVTDFAVHSFNIPGARIFSANHIKGNVKKVTAFVVTKDSPYATPNDAIAAIGSEKAALVQAGNYGIFNIAVIVEKSKLEADKQILAERASRNTNITDLLIVAGNEITAEEADAMTTEELNQKIDEHLPKYKKRMADLAQAMKDAKNLGIPEDKIQGKQLQDIQDMVARLKEQKEELAAAKAKLQAMMEGKAPSMADRVKAGIERQAQQPADPWPSLASTKVQSPPLSPAWQGRPHGKVVIDGKPMTVLSIKRRNSGAKT